MQIPILTALAVILTEVFTVTHGAGEVRLTQETPCMTGQGCRLKCSLVAGDLDSGFDYRLGSDDIAKCSVSGVCNVVFPRDYAASLEDSRTTSYLDIRSFRQRDVGTWSCSDGPSGKVSSIPVVQNDLPSGVLTFGSTCQSGRATSPASLSCSGLSPGDPPASLLLKDSSGQTVGSSNSSSVTGTVTRSGQASCSVSWSALPSYTLNISPVQCTVQGPASVTLSISNTVGRGKVITCLAEGHPDTYTFQPWLQTRGGQEVRRVTGSQQGGQYNLTLTSYNDTGTYICFVDNGVRDNNDQVIVRTGNVTAQIEDAPVLPLPSDPDILSGEIGEPVRVYRSLFSFPALINHTWYFNSTDVTALLPGATTNRTLDMVRLPVYNTTVTVEGVVINLYLTVSQQNSGLYRLEACNRIGCRSASVSLVTAGPPSSPEDLEGTPETHSVVLSWTPGFPGGDFFQWFHVQYSRQDSQEGQWSNVSNVGNRSSSDKTRVTVTVEELEPDTSYVFRVMAQNSRPQKNLSNYTFVAVRTASVAAFPTGALVGGIVGTGAGLLVLMIIIVVLWRRRKRNGSDDAPLQKSHVESGPQGKKNPSFSDGLEDNSHCGHPILEDNPLYDSSNTSGFQNTPSTPQKKTEPQTSTDSSDNVLYSVVDKKAKKAADKGKKTAKKKDKKGKTDNKIYENSDSGKADEHQALEKPGPLREIHADGCVYVSVEGTAKPGQASQTPGKQSKSPRSDDRYKDDHVVYTVIDHTK